MRKGTHLTNVFGIVTTFIFASLLFYYTRNVRIFGYFYLVPVIIAALSYDYIGVVAVATAGALEIGFWIYYLELYLPPSSQALGEAIIGSVLFLVTGLVLAWLSRKQKEHQKLLERTSIHDRLTGLYNYGYFIDRADEEVKRSERYDLKVSLIMQDLDDFKEYNDNYGHERGNAVLKKIARIVNQSVREVDVAARYGGEEFAIILPTTGSEKALALAERIRKAVEAETFEAGAALAPVKITISQGIATYPDTATDVSDLIFQADEALYAAKDGGRNKVRVYSSLEKQKSESQRKSKSL